MPSSASNEDALDYGSYGYTEEPDDVFDELEKEREHSKSLQAQLDAMKEAHGVHNGRDARVLDVSDSRDQWAHVQNARAYDPAVSEASLPSSASDLEFVTKQEHEAALAKAKSQIEHYRIRRNQLQADAAEMQKENDSLRDALDIREDELKECEAECDDLRIRLQTPSHNSLLAAEKLVDFFYKPLGSSPHLLPVLEQVPSFVSAMSGQFLPPAAKKLCGTYAMFSNREQTMFFPETHAARAVIVRSTHKFVKNAESPSGSWQLFDNRTDFSPGLTRQVFWRTGPAAYKYMGAYRCVSRDEMSLDQVPNFPGFKAYSIIRNAVKQHESVSPLITSSVESLFSTSAIRVNCWALERVDYNEKLEDALFLRPPPLPSTGPRPSSSRAPYTGHPYPYGYAPARTPGPHSKRPRDEDSRRISTDQDEGHFYKRNRYH
ncbi:hypothetical protein PENSPDRAFT_648491 [Peniophora sp. CONT]|nr:hypothetical protein PENSPDRAFT_648491 [Peniophora sp. CONT]